MRRSFSKLFHLTIGWVLSYFSGVIFGKKIVFYEDGLYVVSPTPPYISQLANAKKERVDGYHQLIHDEKAVKLFGAKNVEGFSYWAWRACGIVGVQMVLKALLGKKFDMTTMDLINEGLLLGGYDVKNDIGWYHKPLLELGRKYGIKGRLAKFVSSEEIASIVLSGNYVLASIISPSGGHLLLVYGARIKKGKLVNLLVHDPYDLKETGEAKEIAKKSFDNLSTRRIIVFENKNGFVLKRINSN